ncbi:MAG: helix-turn-helix domain-containing protein [Parafannyhessea umbonata]|uniref:helix-turn-helix domain-containing protein n=2 Tax=Parafannyhessea umbonata TaxID=604330 RepID=UPI0026EA1416|nr:helix-turn-helix domain-containing protein [Parafannyhessea umbonata]MDD6359632.1 helix-turn-helix domain-containing protein [Parafannyhessea umbonata]MDD6567022.1 helix-turn-helix domain-containing protein [Parafannyhessea umbonata]
MGFADNVRANRERLGLSQEELARRVGLTNSAVSQWEGGRAKPRIGVMKALSEIFGMTVSELLGEDAPGAGMREPVGRSGMVPMRRLGKTHAGSAVEEIPDDGVVEVPAGVAGRHPHAFMLDVDGDCMDRAYPPGCVVMVDPDMEPWNGCAVVAETQPGESVMRRYMRGSSTLMLSPDSYEEHDDLVFSGDSCAEVRLIGVVVWYQASSDETGR